MAFKMDIDKSYDYILSEKGNAYIALRKISWGGRESKLDIRKYYTNAEGEETIGKGISIDDKTGDALAETLVDTGYGNTNALIESLKKREDFNKKDLPEEEDNDETEYIDIRSEMMA